MGPTARAEPASSPATVGSAIASAAARLREAGSPTPRLDAELLVGHALDRDRTWLLAHPEQPMTAEGAARVGAWVTRRGRGEPVAYIRGFKEWMGLRLRTDSRALIPRPETELLATRAVAEIAARLVRDDAPIVAWDLGTGSGGVAVVLGRRFRAALTLGRVRLIASDRSPDAIQLARVNLQEHDLEALVTAAVADLLEPAGGELPRPDVVAANLPYVPSAEVSAGLGSLAHEPSIALDGGDDGLEVIEHLLADLPRHVARGATVLLEIGTGQADAVLAMAPPGASSLVDPDLAGVERFLRIDMP
jgi:release factor glutamine methyltransferase